MDVMQYMTMFLEESLDNLQNLNDSLLHLEQYPDDVNRINEIFRLAHTLKGMAATMGYTKMAELTHKMEDVLSSFRDGQLKPSKETITVLFQCLDVLERLIRSIEENNTEDYPIEDIIYKLDEVCLCNNDEGHETKIKEPQRLPKIILNNYDLNVLIQGEEKGYSSYEVIITLSEKTLLKSARAFLIFKALEEKGEIIKSEPTVEEIENENFDTEFSLIYVTMLPPIDIEQILYNISEVQEITVLKLMDGSCDRELSIGEQEIIPKEINKEAVEQRNSKVGVIESKKNHQSIRVDIERLDLLMNMVSELVIHRTRLEQLSQSYKSADIHETLEQVGRSTSDIQDLVMKIRMLPLEVVFNRFPRMIRDLSVELNKDMEFIIEGAETELDRTVIDEIGEPLIHLIRNAADHGIEEKNLRESLGKKSNGTIKLIAYQEGTKAVIKVEDDGSGLNLMKIAKKAQSIGIDTTNMTKKEIENLIFIEGFSTNDKVTDLSGRGVGMDVVRTKISSLGGTIEVSSQEGCGTSFIIKLPLTLQIIQALLVKVEEETFAISLGYIDRVINFNKDMVRTSNGREIILYRNSVIPLIRLNKVLRLDDIYEGKQFVIIVKIGEKTSGLLVDSLLGQKEIVIKPLGRTLNTMKEYIGATILGDGLVTLILDAAALV
ncbi:chemotaxis protein CheA [Alloiococcus sp. CFN-8]|uniref:chemotaxis protein CheA n=1 Tax=Alloiococcus sp. CFN-8 TaxID=3416081 RepID=UPI003CF34CAD